MNSERKRIDWDVVIGTAVAGFAAGVFIVPSLVMILGAGVDAVGMMPEMVDPGQVIFYSMLVGAFLGFGGGAIGGCKES